MTRPRKKSRKDWPANLYMNGRGVYFWRHPKDGRTKSLGADPVKAKHAARLMNATLAEMLKPDLVAWVKGAASETTLAEGLDRFLTHWQNFKQRKPGSIENRQYFINRVKAASFSHLPARLVTPLQITDWLRDYYGTQSKSTAIKIREMLREAFDFFSAEGITPPGANPVTVELAGPQVMRDRLELDQFLLIRDRALQEGDLWLARAINLALVTGQRVELVSSLRFADAHDGSLWVVQNKHKADETPVHTMLDLNLRLAAIQLSIGEAVKACRESLIVSEYLIHRTNAQGRGGKSAIGKPLSADHISKRFSKWRNALIAECKLAIGKGKTPPSFHEIRSLTERLYEAQFLDEGMTDEEARKKASMILGHKNVETTAIYADPRRVVWIEVRA